MANKYNFKFTRPPQLDNIWGGGDSLGRKLETALTRFIQRVINWGHEFYAELKVDIFDASMKILQPGMKRAMQPLMNELLKNPGLPDYIKSTLESIRDEEGESGVILEALVIYTTMMSMITGGLSPFRRIAEMRTDELVRSFLPPISELAQLNKIGLVSDAAFVDNAKKLGVADPLIPVYKEYVRNLPSLGELFNGFWRGVYSENDFKAQIKRMGYGDKDVTLFLELSKNLPPIQDFIRFQVRDAFDNGVAARYGYDDGDVSELAKYAKLQGYDPEIAKLYWRAHWNLPSPTQGYEMLHRGQITSAELDELLRIADYPTFWREKLMAISYHPYTRVDIRRMYQAGVLNPDEVFTAYKDAGYDDVKAQKLADFAMTGASTKEKDLTRSDILNLYENNLLDRGEAEQGLIKLGYDGQEAGQYMDMADFNIAKSTRADDIRYVQEKYLANTITETGVMSELTAIGLTSNQIERYVLQWNRAIETKITFPSKADAVKFYVGGLIDEARFRGMLADLGYRADDINLYVLANVPSDESDNQIGAI